MATRPPILPYRRFANADGQSSIYKLNSAHPLVANLTFACIAGQPYDLVTGRSLVNNDQSGSGRNYPTITQHNGYNVVSTGSYMVKAPTDANHVEAKRFDKTGNFSAFVLANQSSNQNGNVSFGRLQGSSTNLSWYLGLHSGSYNYTLARFSDFNNDSAAAPFDQGLDTKKPTQILMTVGSTRNVNVYTNGILYRYGSATLDPTYEYSPSSNRQVYIGSLSHTNFQQTVQPSLALFWDKELTANEVRQLSENPWALFTTDTDINYPQPRPFIKTSRKSNNNTDTNVDGILNYDNYLARDLWVGFDHRGGSYGRRPVKTTLNSGYTTVNTAYGPAVSPTVANSGFTIPAMPSTNVPELTMVLVTWQASAIAPSGSCALFGDTYAGPSYTGFTQYTFGGGYTLYATIYYYPDFNGSVIYTSLIVPQKGLSVSALSFRKSDVYKVYLNGIKQYETAAGAFNASFNTSNFAVSANQSNTHNLAVLKAFAFDRALSDEEMKSITTNPWQIFKGNDRITPSELVNTDSGILIPPYLSSNGSTVTTSTVTPKIKLNY